MANASDMVKETSSGLQHGHTQVGTLRVALCHNFPTFRGILIRSAGPQDPVPNTDIIWIGGARVTADTSIGTSGYPLFPGESISIPVDQTGAIYAIASSGVQDLAWMGV